MPIHCRCQVLERECSYPKCHNGEKDKTPMKKSESTSIYHLPIDEWVERKAFQLLEYHEKIKNETI